MSATETLLAEARGLLASGRAAVISVAGYGAPFEVTAIREDMPHSSWSDGPDGWAERLLHATMRHGPPRGRTFPLSELCGVRPGDGLP